MPTIFTQIFGETARLVTVVIYDLGAYCVSLINVHIFEKVMTCHGLDSLDYRM